MFRLSGTHELHTKWLYEVRPPVLECEEVFCVAIERYERVKISLLRSFVEMHLDLFLSILNV